MYLVKMRGRCHNLFYFTYIYYIMNLSFKIPQWLFILVIVVLVIFVLYKLCSTRESLVNYNSAISSNDLVNFPGVTDASGVKLYDNNYYWPETGTIIRVFGREPPATPATGETVDADLDYVIVYDRNGNESAPINSSVVEVPNEDNTATTSILSLETTPAGTKLAAGQQLSPAFYEWYTLPVAPPAATDATATDYSTIVTNQLFYATFNLDTYIHIVDKDDTGDYVHNGFFESNGVVTKEAYNAVDVKNVSYVASVPSYSVGPVNGEQIAGKTLNDCYRLGAFLYMSLHTGDLYLLTTNNEGDDQLVQYKRSNGSSTNSITVPTTGIIPSNSTKFLVADERGGNVIVYVAIQQYTLIMILNLQSDGSFKLPASNGVWRMGSDGPITFAFGESGDDDSDSDNGDENNGDENNGDENNGDENNGDDDSDSDDDDENNNGGNNEGGSDYWKWYWYWNSTNTPPGGFSDDYMLKTEVVPPVCPACPAYQVNCGGNGNMGSKGSSGSQGTNLSDAVGTTVTTAGDVAGKALDSGTAALDKTLDTASDLLKSTGSGAMQLTNTVLDSAGNLVSGTADLARDTATGTVGLARDTVTGTVDLAQDTASNTADFVRDMNYGAHRTGSATGSSAAGYYQQHGTMAGYQANNYLTPAMDPYTYNGQLPDRPESNYIPRTNSFAAFSK